MAEDSKLGPTGSSAVEVVPKITKPPRPERPVAHPVIELTTARVVEFMRDPGALFWTFGFPVILAVALGLAFRSGSPVGPRVALNCESGCVQLRTALESGGSVTLVSLERGESLDALRRGKLDLVVDIPAGPSAAPQLHLDPTRPEALTARLAVKLGLAAVAGQLTETREQALTQAGSRYIDFLIPGLVGLNVMSSALWGIGFSVVDSRKRRLLKLMSATPMRRGHYLLSIMLSRMFFLFVEVLFLVGFGWLAFGVPMQGALGSILLVSTLGSLSFAGLGLLVASRTDSTEVAGGWSNLVMLPMWLLSGCFFSYERFPEGLKPFIQALPLTALNDALRAIWLEGAGLWACGLELAVMLAWAALTFALALRIFRWQ